MRYRLHGRTTNRDERKQRQESATSGRVSFPPDFHSPASLVSAPEHSARADPAEEITRLAARWSQGDRAAFDQLIDVVYDDLRRIAHHHLQARGRDAVVDTTVLVHEAYLKLAGVDGARWPSRAHFFAFCSKAMRRLLIDYARERQAEKRGGARVQVPLSDNLAQEEVEVLELLAVEEALLRLEEKNARMARIAECRFFGGMSVPETAEALETSVRTVEREWARARVYLLATLGPG